MELKINIKDFKEDINCFKIEESKLFYINPIKKLLKKLGIKNKYCYFIYEPNLYERSLNDSIHIYDSNGNIKHSLNLYKYEVPERSDSLDQDR